MYQYPRIREMRKKHRLTQRELAEMIDTSQKQYSKYEIGVQEFPLHLAIQLAKLFNVSLDYLVGLADEPNPLSQK